MHSTASTVLQVYFPFFWLCSELICFFLWTLLSGLYFSFLLPSPISLFCGLCQVLIFCSLHSFFFLIFFSSDSSPSSYFLCSALCPVSYFRFLWLFSLLIFSLLCTMSSVLFSFALTLLPPHIFCPLHSILCNISFPLSLLPPQMICGLCPPSYFFSADSSPSSYFLFLDSALSPILPPGLCSQVIFFDSPGLCLPAGLWHPIGD